MFDLLPLSGEGWALAWKVQGGTALYLKDRLNERFVKSYSNSVVEFVIATSKVLDAVFVSIYRLPDTSIMEWKSAIDTLMH